VHGSGHRRLTAARELASQATRQSFLEADEGELEPQRILMRPGLSLAYGVAVMEAAKGQPHYLAIMLPGFVTGAIIGFSTQRMAKAA